MSPEFAAAFEGIGAPEIQCACGRVNYARDGDIGRVALITNADVEHVGNAVLAKLVGGNAYVVGCKCNFFERFEAILWHDRLRITRYLRERSQAGAAKALGDAIEIDRALGGAPTGDSSHG